LFFPLFFLLFFRASGALIFFAHNQYAELFPGQIIFADFFTPIFFALQKKEEPKALLYTKYTSNTT